MELGISRTPVRDAIQRLAQEKYIDVIPSKGFCIHEMPEQDLIEKYRIRYAFERFCTVQLARNKDTEKARNVIKILEHLVETKRCY